VILQRFASSQNQNRRIPNLAARQSPNEVGLGDSVLELILAKINPEHQGTEKTRVQRELVDAVYSLYATSPLNDPSELQISINRRKGLEDCFISALSYFGMEDREERIAEAHIKTVQWIFADGVLDSSTATDNQVSYVEGHHEVRWSNFKSWLESDKQLYWITGKAGSGKSTLMKFICSQPAYPEPTSERALRQSKLLGRCKKHLMKWAAGDNLVIASFYFWNSGEQLQMSRRGFLLSLLSQILRQIPQLIPLASPSRWEALCLFNANPRDWTEEELLKALRITTQRAPRNFKFCLFIDGLDEFDGNPSELISLVKDLLRNENVKVCVASRPWVVFEDAFKHEPSLMLQHLTYNDIKAFVTSKFHAESGFDLLRRREPAYADQLIENVVVKAAGVFLWVQLVVGSLVSGMSNADRISELQYRLDQLPPDLEALYEKIIMSIDPLYVEHAAQLFNLVIESPEPLSLVLLSFADEEDISIAQTRAVEPISEDEVALRAETMHRRLNSRCMGLLEAAGPDRTVEFLHRTAKDYIQSDDARLKLQSALQSSFDAHIRLCASNLALLKLADLKDGAPHNNRKFWTLIQCCLYSAARIAPQTSVLLITTMLDELDRVATLLTGTYPSQIAYIDKFLEKVKRGSWILTHPQALKFDLRSSCSLLSMAVRYGVTEYVKAKAERGCLVKRPGMPPSQRSLKWPLLYDALDDAPHWAHDHASALPSPEMVQCLLNLGADPNYRPSDMHLTSWQVLLGKDALSPYLYTQNHISAEPWASIVDLMVAHGADVKLGRKSGLIWSKQKSPSEALKSVRAGLLSDEEECIQRETPSRSSRRFRWPKFRRQKK
jgi:hypothetical protein